MLAVDLIENPELAIDVITATTASDKGYSDDELAVFRIGDNDIAHLVVKIYGFGQKRSKRTAATVRQEMRDFVLDAVFEDSIDKTPTFTLSVHDPDWELLNMGALDKPIDINPGMIKGRWYRLDTFSVTDDTINLVFATRNAVYLSGHRRPMKSSRGKMTRAQFIQALTKKVKKSKIKFYCPQLNRRQQQAKFTSDSNRKKHGDRSPGFTDSDKITVKNHPADKEQRGNIEKIIEAGVDVNAPGLVIVSAIMCTTQEADARQSATNGHFVGCFQQNGADGWPATRDPYKDAKGNGKQGQKQGGYYGMAIPAWRENPDIDLGIFIQKVQGADPTLNPQNSGYAQEADRWRDEAQHAVNAYGGIDVDDPGSPSDTSYRKAYEFMVGEPKGPWNENYLAATYRMADEVNWSAYWVRDVLHFMSQEDLFKAKARDRWRRFEKGVETVSFSWDRLKKVDTMTLGVRMERWVCPVGTVVVFDEGGPVKGRWIVTNIRRSMFDELGEIILAKPKRERKEPAPDPGHRKDDPDESSSDVTGSVNDVGGLAYPLAERGKNLGGPAAHGARPLHNWQSDNAIDIGVPVGTRVFAVDDGVVTKAAGYYINGAGQTEGLTITIQTDNDKWFYQHNSWRKARIVQGAKVRKGELLAHSGSGRSVPHLHIACEKGNPEQLLGWRGNIGV